MPYSLISNGEHYWKYSGHLLRNPLTKIVSLTPNEMAYYAVAGSYKLGLPTAGVIDTTGTNAYYRSIRSGKLMRKYYLNSTARPTTGIMMWRAVNQAHEPEFVFYQGSYSTATGYDNNEAFMQIPAYHFEIPSQYQDFAITSAVLHLTHGGSIITWGRTLESDNYNHYFMRDAPTSLLEAGSPWRNDWTQSLGIYQSLNQDPYIMYRDAVQEVTLTTASGSVGDADADTGRLLWENSEQYYADGYIPITTTPWMQSITLNNSIVSTMNTYKQGWLVMMPDVSVSTLTNSDNENDYPCYTAPMSAARGYWACTSYWGYRLTVTLSL